MILVDTNIWIEHFKSSSPKLVELLMAGEVLTHDFILGELSLAHFNKKDRIKIFERLESLQKVTTSSHEDVYKFVRTHKFAGKGIGWIDSHLLHACVSQKATLWTADKNLAVLARRMVK